MEGRAYAQLNKHVYAGWMAELKHS